MTGTYFVQEDTGGKKHITRFGPSSTGGLTEEEQRNLEKSMDRHKGALERLAGDHTCQMRYKGIRETLGNPVEIWECSICGRESVSPYTGTQDTIELRE